ncbi:MAG: hypothetical protein GY765_22670, partial [bacterium]|nr:hypothetical protein [bacterium]
MERIFNIVLSKNVSHRLENPEEMQKVNPSPHLQGYFEVKNGKKTVVVITGLLPGDAVSVMAHELTHAWNYENRIGDDWNMMTREGFAEWVAFHVAAELHFPSAAGATKLNRYKVYREGFIKFR